MALPDNGRYRRISQRMHADAKFRRLTDSQPCGKALWYHLLTGPHTGIIPGVSVAGEYQLAETLHWPVEGFREAFGEVFREGLAEADWEARLVWLPNGLKHNPPQSPNVVRSWRDAWIEIPECPLKAHIYQQVKAFLEAIGKAFVEAFREAMPEPGTGTGTGTGPSFGGGESAQARDSLPRNGDSTHAERREEAPPARRRPPRRERAPLPDLPAELRFVAGMPEAWARRVAERTEAGHPITPSQALAQFDELRAVALAQGEAAAVRCVQLATANGWKPLTLAENRLPPPKAAEEKVTYDRSGRMIMPESWSDPNHPENLRLMAEYEARKVEKRANDAERKRLKEQELAAAGAAEDLPGRHDRPPREDPGRVTL